MGLYLIYCEILLALVTGSGERLPSLYFIMFSISIGLVQDAVLLISGKLRNTAYIILSVLVSLYFALECTLKVLFGVFFSFSNMTASAQNVMTHYGGDTFRGIILGLAFFMLFLLPAIICYVCLRIKKTGSVFLFRKLSALNPGKAALAASAAIFCAVAIHAGSSRMAVAGPYGFLYDTHFNFRDGVETFGLSEATFLSLVRSESVPLNETFADEPESLKEVAVTKAEEETVTAPAEAASETMPASATAPLPSAEPVPESPTESTAAFAVSTGFLPPAEEIHVPEYNVMDLTFPTEGVPSGMAALSEYIQKLEPSLKNDRTGLFTGKNLVMICAESYDDAFIRPEFTPTLYRLTHNGFYFSEYYQPSWGGSTSTGELSMLLGLDSNDGAEAFQNIAGNDHYFSMGRRLSEQGYLGACFHNGSHTFYRRDLTHINLGYDEFYACGKNLEDFTGHPYPSDSEMLSATLPYYVEHYLADKQPFNLYYMTVTGHAPYVRDSLPVREYWEKVDGVLGDEYAEKTKYYICYQMELEKMLTLLMEHLEEAGIADDTVIVLTSDHYPYGLGNNPVWGNDRNYNNDLKKEKTGSCFVADRTGLIIWSGCLEHGNSEEACEVREPVFSLDILPTLLNLFGIEFDSRLLPGRDVFGGTSPLVYWNNLSWITDKGRYLTKGHSFTPAEGVTFTPEEEASYIDSVNIQVGNRIKMSTSIMKYDYYRLVFNDEKP